MDDHYLPERDIMKFVARLFSRFGALLNRLTCKSILVNDLPVGSYRTVSWDKKQTVRDHTPYAYRTIVTTAKGTKSWLVLSDKQFYSNFTIVADGATNRVG